MTFNQISFLNGIPSTLMNRAQSTALDLIQTSAVNTSIQSTYAVVQAAQTVMHKVEHRVLPRIFASDAPDKTPDTSENRAPEASERVDHLQKTNEKPHNPRVYINALLMAFAKFQKPNSLFFISKEPKVFLMTPQEGNHEELFKAILKEKIGKSEDKILGPETTEDLEQYKQGIPNTEEKIIRAIAQLMEIFKISVIFSTGTGFHVPFFDREFQDLPEEIDHLDHILKNQLGIPIDDLIADTEVMEEELGNNLEVENREYSTAEIIEPFSGVFLRDNVLNAALKSVGLKQMIAHRNQDLLELIKEGEVNFPNGMILNGPPGTGKSILMESIGQAYARAGAPVKEISLESLEDKYVGSFGKNITAMMDDLILQSQEAGRPGLLIIDEGDNIATGVGQSGESRRYYQAALNAIKRYTTRYPEIVIILATNAETRNLDTALTRSKRLQVVTVNEPNDKIRARMFGYFLQQFDILSDLKEEQLERLARILPESQGADIRAFCESYKDRLKRSLHAEQGRSTLLDEIHYLFVKESGPDFTDADIRELITYDRLLTDLKAYAASLTQVKAGRRRIGL